MKEKSRLTKAFWSLLALPLWFGTSLFVLGTAIYLLTSPGLPLFLPMLLQKTLSYSLYSALPERGSVLGHFVATEDARELKLTSYLQKQNSPMAAYANVFIKAADEYKLPWTLLPAIAGKESGFGKAIPKGSYNPFGWGVFTGQQSGVAFSSWEDAILKVARGLREEYFNRGLDTPDLIEPIYAPPSPGKGHPWLLDVTFLMEEIENWR